MGRSSGVPALLALAALAAAGPASAALGEPAGSISKDEKALAAVRGEPTAQASFTVERLVSPAGTVREYVSPSGVVFAVTWEGLSHPDLSRLLGPYAAPFHRALAHERRRTGQRSRRIETAGVVVETWGLMRALHGRAYVPALVPAGVAVDDLR